MITLLDMDRGRGGGRWMTAAIWALIALTMVVNGRHADRSNVLKYNVHHKMTKRELRHTFDVDDTKEVPPYDLIDSTHFKWTSTKISDQPRLLFEAFNERYDIVLSPHDKLLSPDLITVIRDGPDSRIHHGLPYESACHFRGVAISHENASVAFSNCTHLRGSIALSDHFLVIHPMPQRFRLKKDSIASQHVIFKRAPALAPNGASLGVNTRVKRTPTIWREGDDMIEDDESTRVRANDLSAFEEFCDVSMSGNETLPFLALRDDPGSSFGYGPLTLEMALFLDTQLYQHFSDEFGSERAEEELVDFALALINNEETDGSKHKNGEAQLFLDTFCTYQAQLNPGNRALKVGKWDHATLLTGYDIYHTTSSVAGVAPVARMCDQVFSCSLVEGLHLGRSFVLAHEMGHNLGMVHDGVQNQCSRSCCLMSAVNGAGKTTWSPCSVRELNAYILSLGSPGAASNCLSDGEHAPEAKDHKLKGLLPGQRFTADQQCSFFWGRDFRNEIPAGKSKSEICNILWCGNGGSTISTSHPALEGTWCGPDKWCSNGQCSSWPPGSTPPKPVDGVWSHWITTSKSVCSDCKIANGVRVRKDIRGCDDPAPNNGGKDCKGSPIRGVLCDSDKSKCGNVEKQKFADDICAALKEDGTAKGDTDLSGKSFLHSTSPCKIWCHLGDTKLIRNKGFFPDGTPCGIEKHCVDGECLELSCDRKALVFESPTDCPNSTGIVPTPASISGWATWSTWSSCSVTCGKGTRSRKRKCNGDSASCNGSDSDQEECPFSKPLECGTWSPWSVWGDCSVTCGQGTRLRSRNCRDGNDCTGDTTITEPCGSEPCKTGTGSWSDWTAWSVCTKTCGADGQRSRRRTCQNGEKCTGESQQTEACPRKDCADKVAGLYSWNAWATCSVTCGPGRQTRTRPCPFNSDPAILVENCVGGTMSEDRECNTQPCPDAGQNTWSEWSPFGPCTVTCGFGLQSRSRTCPSKVSNCGGGHSNDTKACFAGGCPTTRPTVASTVSLSTVSSAETGGGNGWSAWALWSSCSRTCGGGFRQRIRYCRSQSVCPPSGSIQIDNCNIHECDSEWTQWSTWSTCSRTCGSDGQRTRNRRCLALDSRECVGADKEAVPCEGVLPACAALITAEPKDGGVPVNGPEWSQWSAWSACSCYNDKSLRRRYCRIVQPTVLGFCVGPVLDERDCVPRNCTPVPGGWSQWSEWSVCSADCTSSANPSGGYRIRHRQCSDPFPVNRGPYCFGQSFEKAPCGTSLPSCSGSAVDGSWSDWSSWSTCSLSCNAGHKSRTRYCTNPSPSNGGRLCQGLDFNLEVCPVPEHCPSSNSDGGWSAWSSWSSCSQTCGFAFQARQRMCDSPKPSSSRTCLGLAYMTKLCTLPQCPNSVNGGWSAWLDWSECSVQCGYGIRARTRNCDSPAAANGGTPCFGASTDVVLCSGREKDCSLTDEHFETIEELARKWEKTDEK